jgi:hypothetical protein
MPAKPRSKKRPRIGRPPTNPTQVRLTLLPDALASLDAYAKRNGLTRAMAARQAIEAFFSHK